MTLSDADWAFMLRQIREERCVAFLGAGASLGTGQHEGVPSAAELAEALADAAPDPKSRYQGTHRRDLFRMAQYLEDATDELFLRKTIIQQINKNGNVPGPIHQKLAALPFPCFLTTNFDNLMENALRAFQKIPTVAHYNRLANSNMEIGVPTVKAPLVYKFHGTVDDWESILVTEHNLVEFMACVLLNK